MARSESLCQSIKLFPQHLVFKTRVSFIKDLRRRDPLSPLHVSSQDQEFPFFSGFGFARVSGGRGGLQALESAWAPPAPSPNGAGSPSSLLPTHFRNTQTKDIRIFGPKKKKRVCVSKDFPKTSTQTKLDSQQQRNQMRTNEENASGSGSGIILPPGH